MSSFITYLAQFQITDTESMYPWCHESDRFYDYYCILDPGLIYVYHGLSPQDKTANPSLQIYVS